MSHIAQLLKYNSPWKQHSVVKILYIFKACSVNIFPVFISNIFSVLIQPFYKLLNNLNPVLKYGYLTFGDTQCMIYRFYFTLIFSTAYISSTLKVWIFFSFRHFSYISAHIIYSQVCRLLNPIGFTLNFLYFLEYHPTSSRLLMFTKL